ncbi:hypothetical protein, partial [Streptosporangium sandarakinum]
MSRYALMYVIMIYYHVHERSWRRGDQENPPTGRCATPARYLVHHPDRCNDRRPATGMNAVPKVAA